LGKRNPAPADGKPTVDGGIVFEHPNLNSFDGRNYPLNWCRVANAECGKPAADEYCRIKAGATFAASEFIQLPLKPQGPRGAYDRHRPSILVSSRNVILDENQSIFLSISCSSQAVGPWRPR
jgi:hypothetical protein